VLIVVCYRTPIHNGVQTKSIVSTSVQLNKDDVRLLRRLWTEYLSTGELTLSAGQLVVERDAALVAASHKVSVCCWCCRWTQRRWIVLNFDPLTNTTPHTANWRCAGTWPYAWRCISA